MKKYSALMICFLLVSSLFAQEKYPVPVLTSDQKLDRTLSQTWLLATVGIKFAKTHGLTPYEYGKYMGELFAPSWGDGNDFDTFVKGSVYNYENFRIGSDPVIVVKENKDGSVSIVMNDKIFHKYLPEGNPYGSYSDFLEFMKGINEPIANYMGATFKPEVRDSLLIFTLKKK